MEKYINWVKQEYRLNIILISPLSTAVYANNNLIDLHLFRIIQEALSNIVKHAKAENCLITFKVDQDLRLFVKCCGLYRTEIFSVRFFMHKIL